MLQQLMNHRVHMIKLPTQITKRYLRITGCFFVGHATIITHYHKLMKTAYSIAWITWITWFLAWELTALFTGHDQYTLSDYVWRLEEINSQWTFARYLIAVSCLWLFFHLAFGWFR